MAKLVKQLTDTEIKKIKPKEKDFKISDGQGLYFVIKKNGTKFFRFDFVFGGKRKTMSFGIYPTVSLKEARYKRKEARNNIEKNINPINQKNLDKTNQKLTFEYVAEEWVKSVQRKLSPVTTKNYMNTLKKNVYPLIGNVEIQNITRVDIVKVLNKIKLEYSSVNRIYNLLSRIYSFSVVTYNLESNPIDFKLTDIISRKATVNHIAIVKKDEIRELVKKIKDFNIEDKEYLHYSGVYAIKILPYVFVRISSLLMSEWEHIDFEEGTWFFPAANTKTKKDYLYPMPEQVIDLLLDLNEHIEFSKIKSKYIFHSAQNNPLKHLSRATVSTYLKVELGYKNKMSLHGFRSTFATTAYENEELHKQSSLIIESCLSHTDGNRIRGAYNRESITKYLKQKKDLIQWYANWLDSL